MLSRCIPLERFPVWESENYCTCSIIKGSQRNTIAPSIVQFCSSHLPGVMKPELLQRSFMSHGGLRVIHHHFFSSRTLAVIAKLESKWDQNHLNMLKAPKQKGVNEYVLVSFPN